MNPSLMQYCCSVSWRALPYTARILDSSRFSFSNSLKEAPCRNAPLTSLLPKRLLALTDTAAKVLWARRDAVADTTAGGPAVARLTDAVAARAAQAAAGAAEWAAAGEELRAVGAAEAGVACACAACKARAVPAAVAAAGIWHSA